MARFLHQPLQPATREKLTARKATYPPPADLGSALFLRLGLVGGLSPAALLYLARGGNLLLWLGATWLTLRLCPLRRWALVTLPLTPAVLFQASSVGADPPTNRPHPRRSLLGAQGPLAARRGGPAGGLPAGSRLAAPRLGCRDARAPRAERSGGTAARDRGSAASLRLGPGVRHRCTVWPLPRVLLPGPDASRCEAAARAPARAPPPPSRPPWHSASPASRSALRSSLSPSATSRHAPGAHGARNSAVARAERAKPRAFGCCVSRNRSVSPREAASANAGWRSRQDSASS
jgi:hypothetical protein